MRKWKGSTSGTTTITERGPRLKSARLTRESSRNFSLYRTLHGMMAIFSRLFGIRFREIPPDQYALFGEGHVITWHEEVSVYSVWDDSSSSSEGDFLGYLYLDLFPRDDKYNHAGHYLLQPVGIHYPNLKLLSSNIYTGIYNIVWTAPTSRLRLGDEPPQAPATQTQPAATRRDPLAVPRAGARSAQSRVAGALCRLPRDVCGARLCRDSQYHAGELVVDASRGTGAGVSLFVCQRWQFRYISTGTTPGTSGRRDDPQSSPDPSSGQRAGRPDTFHLTMFDMAVHSPSTRAEAEAMNLSAMWNRMLSEVTMLSGLEEEDGWEWGHGCTRFGFIVRGYEAGYYAYPL